MIQLEWPSVRLPRCLWRSCVFTATLTALACGDGTATARAPETGAAVETPAASSAPSDSATSGPRRHVRRSARAAAGSGRLQFAYGRTTTSEHKDIQRIFRDERFFEEQVIAQVNENFVLPRNIKVTLEECDGDASAFYDPEDGGIHLCYEMFEHFLETFTPDPDAESDDETAEVSDAEAEDVGGKAVAALVFIFYHELGHALVDVFDLPITGKEEDAVDQLATVILLETWDGEDSELALTASAEWFGSSSGDEEVELDMADEHSLDDQRFYNLVCWTYGSDPEYFADMVEDWGLPAARAERCPEEYAKMSRSWDALLGPHMRVAAE